MPYGRQPSLNLCIPGSTTQVVGVTGFEPASPKSLIYSQMGQPIAQHSLITMSRN